MNLEQCLVIASAAIGKGDAIAAPTPGETDALLDLTRAVAHASERKAAPLAAFAVGAALARLTPDERVVVIRVATAAIDAAQQGEDEVA
jgi:hypothetical protein